MDFKYVYSDLLRYQDSDGQPHLLFKKTKLGLNMQTPKNIKILQISTQQIFILLIVFVLYAIVLVHHILLIHTEK